MIISLLLLFVMVLSVSASFAASDDAGDLIAVDDTADDDVVATDDSNQDTLKEAPVVTKDNFNDYFDESGTYSSDEEELVFEGDFSGLDISAITIAGESTVKFTGKNATFKNVQVMIMQDDVTIDGFNFVTDDANPHTRLIHIIGAEEGLSDIVLSNNNITFIGPKNNEAYAIFAGGDTVSGSCEVSGLQIINNNITYVGNSDGTQINNVIRVNGDTDEEWASDEIVVQGNNFDIQIPSIKIEYGDFGEAKPLSEAIVFYYCDDVKFLDNKIKIKANNKIGSQDTINVVSVYGDSLMMMTSSNIIISGNEIEGVGGSAIYGIKVSADDFEVTNNKINLSSDDYYANGISIEGPSSNGLVDKNNITLTAPADKYTSVYGIYTWQMMGSNLNVTYSNNIIDTTGYLACGMEINQPDPVIGTNTITSKGNFTYGIAASIRPANSEAFIRNNVINCLGNNIGFSSGDSILKTASAGISTLGKATISGNKINSTSVGIISVDKGEVAIFDNEINVTATGDNDNYAIKIDGVEKLELNNNNITFVGSTDGSSIITIALDVSDVSDALIFENNFDIQIPSVDVPWFEVPEGSGNWISTPISEGILIEYSDNVIFDGNDIKLEFNSVSTAKGYDTIYVVDFVESDNAVITNNKIKGNGKDHIYGLIVNGDNFTIRANNITSSSEFYANGIDIEGPASGVVEDNNISVYSDVSAYGIYSGMNGQDVVANYTGNSISGKAYNIFGFSLGDVKSELVKNDVLLDGNYTTGFAYYGGEAFLKENIIVLISSEEGNETVMENFGVESVGVKVLKGNVTVFNNTIGTQGKGIHISGNKSNVDVNENFINVVGNDDKNAFAVYVNDAGDVDVIGNTIDYQGTTQGVGINNAVFIYETDGVIIAQNKFNLDLVSSYVNWLEIPEGSGDYVAFPVSEGIVVEDSNDVLFDSNNVTVEYTDVVGSDDTIYSVAFKNSNNAVITNNNITSKGKKYIYGLQVSGDEFIVRANTINSTAEYYANGIDIEGPASGVVEDNNISVYSDVSAYGIYSGMNGQDVVANYTGNSISGKAYNIFGFSLGDVKSELVKNDVLLDGNYTTGFAYYGGEAFLKENIIVLMSSEEGNETVWENFGVESVGVKVLKGNVTVFNNTIGTQGKGIHISGNKSNVDVNENFINVVGNDDKNAFAVYVNDAGDVDVIGNTIDYQGTTQGAGINNAVFIYETDGVIIAQNKFNLDLVSSYVNWLEIPEGSWNYVAFPISEGIVVEDSNDVLFDSNNVNVEYTDVVGSDDTIYSVAFKNSNNSVITNNNITSKGNTYIYGLQVSGDKFIVRANTINTTGEHYANGIDIEGPASGVVDDNTIIAKASNVSYPIYSGMNGKPVSVDITGNDIQGEAYLAIGVEIAGQEALVQDNNIVVKGNHTMGIASKVDKLNVVNNQIVSDASNKGNESIWEAFGTNTTGIKIAGGQATISSNNVKTTGDYAIDVADTNSTIQPNHVESAKGSGVNAVHSTGNATIDVKIKTSITAPASVTVLLTKVKSGYTIKVVLKDSEGKVLAKSPITVNGKAFTTDANGAVNYKVSASKVGTQTLNINYAGTDVYAPSTAKVTVKITKEKTKLTAKKKTFKAKKKVKKYTVVLKDSKKKAIKNVKVTLKVKGKTYKAKTNSKGKATFKIKNLKKKGTYKAKVKFAGNKYYKASSKSVKIKIKK